MESGQSGHASAEASFCSTWTPRGVGIDNGTAFTSAEFQNFVQRNVFRHITSAPYHPATNGLAERAVHVDGEKCVTEDCREY